MLQSLGAACQVRVAFDTEPLSEGMRSDPSCYFDSLADYLRWLPSRSEGDLEIVSVTMRVLVGQAALPLGSRDIEGVPGATMQFDGYVLIVSVTDPTTLRRAYNAAYHGVGDHRPTDDEPEAQGLR